MTARRQVLIVLAAVATITLDGRARAASRMSVEEAYRAIPHQRTVFDATNVKMNRADAEYLQRLFLWIDQAIVAKVSAMTDTPAAEAYAAVWSMQSAITPPAKFAPLQGTVAEAIHHEYEYLKQRQAAGVKTFNAASPHVQSASQSAQRAYGMLMSLYSSETAHNKQAFYDYLCALDFL